MIARHFYVFFDYRGARRVYGISLVTHNILLLENRVLCLKKRLFTDEINGAGWSSPVAREAHNLEVVGSNPAPATCIADFMLTEPPGDWRLFY